MGVYPLDIIFCNIFQFYLIENTEQCKEPSSRDNAQKTSLGRLKDVEDHSLNDAISLFDEGCIMSIQLIYYWNQNALLWQRM